MECCRRWEKRPVSSDDVEMAINHIKSRLRATSEREVPSKMIGNLVMEQLKKLDASRLYPFCLCLPQFRRYQNLAKRIGAPGGLSRAGRVLHGAGAKAGATRTFYHASQPECRVRHLSKDGEIVSEGYHHRAGEPHAGNYMRCVWLEKNKGATAYVTLEPCSHHRPSPPCCDALIAAGVARVVASMQILTRRSLGVDFTVCNRLALTSATA